MKLRFGKCVNILLTAIIIVLGQFGVLFAQVSIAPTTIFIAKSTHFGTFSVQNTSNKRQEVSVRFKFGYAVTDSAGNMHMDYRDTTKAHKYSIAPWIHAFPRNFTLGPSQTQTIRIMARPPVKLPGGMFWTRMFVTSNPQSSLVGSKNKSKVSASINFRFVQVIAVFYDNGKAKTGIDFKKLKLQKDKTKLDFLSDVKQLGNSPFLGTVYLKVYNNKGKIVASNDLITTIYFNETVNLGINKKKLSPGTYKAVVTFKTGRRDISNSHIVEAPPVSKSIKFRIQ